MQEPNKRLSEILTSIISGEFPGDLVDSFMKEEDPGSALKFRDYSGLLLELEKQSRLGLIATPSFLHNHATALFAYIQEVLKQYYFPPAAENPVLSASEMLGLILGGMDKFEAPNDFALEAAALISENAEKRIADELLLPRLLLAAALLNLSAKWTKAGMLDQEEERYIPANIADALKRHFQPPVYQEKLSEGLHLAHLLELIFKDRLEEVFYIMQGESMHPDIEFLKRFLESPSDPGLFLLTFEEYRMKRNNFAYGLIQLLDEKFHFLSQKNSPPNEPDATYLVAGSIERDIEDRIKGHLILEKEAEYWKNRIKAMYTAS